jgi:hypothetical protein
VNAPRAGVYRALLYARAVATWKVPTGMTSHVHEFDAREGGSFRTTVCASQFESLLTHPITRTFAPIVALGGIISSTYWDRS